MRLRKGNFGGFRINAIDLSGQSGKFGYMLPNDLRFSGDEVGVEVGTSIWRDPHKAETVLVEVVKGGFKLTCIGFDGYEFTPLRPMHIIVPVVEFELGGKTYTKWSGKLLCKRIADMARGSSAYIRAIAIDERDGKLSTVAGVPLKHRRGKGLVPVRHNRNGTFTVRYPRKGWVNLAVDQG